MDKTIIAIIALIILISFGYLLIRWARKEVGKLNKKRTKEMREFDKLKKTY